MYLLWSCKLVIIFWFFLAKMATGNRLILSFYKLKKGVIKRLFTPFLYTLYSSLRRIISPSACRNLLRILRLPSFERWTHSDRYLSPIGISLPIGAYRQVLRVLLHCACYTIPRHQVQSLHDASLWWCDRQSFHTLWKRWRTVRTGGRCLRYNPVRSRW